MIVQRTPNGSRTAQVAAELGYSDHAHLAADFRTVLGLAPSSYRREVAWSAAERSRCSE